MAPLDTSSPATAYVHDTNGNKDVPAPETPTKLSRFNEAVNGRLERWFDSLGRFIGKRPWVVITVSIAAAIVLLGGMIRIEEETRDDKLWVATDTEAAEDNDFVEDHFPALSRLEGFYVTRKDGGDVILPEAFDRALTLLQDTYAVTWSNVRSDGSLRLHWRPDIIGYTDVCLSLESVRGASTPLNCMQSNLLELFSYDPSRWTTRADILAVLNDRSTWNTTLIGAGFIAETYLGKLEVDESGAIAGAKSLSFTFRLAGNQTLIDDQEDDPAAEGWEEEWLDFMEEQEDADETFNFPRLAERSFADEFGGQIENDFTLLQVAIIAIALYTYIVLSKFKDNCVGSRVLLTLGGLLGIGLGVGSAYGLGGWVGLLFTPLMTVMPFIMFGIGVDGIFVLQAALDRTDPAASMEERMGETLSTAGVSVTVASLTNFAAFAIGSNTSLPALSAFSLYAAFGVLFDLLIQITFFAAVMSLDARRQIRRRWDVVACVKSSAPEDFGACCGVCGPGVPHEKPSIKLMRAIGRSFASPIVKGVILTLWVVLLAVGIVGTARMEVKADINDFVPDNSYLEDFIDIWDNDFGSEGTAVAFYTVSTEEEPVDLSDPATGAALEAALVELQANEWTVAASFDSWYTAFKEASGGQLAQATFYDDLREFLTTPAGSLYTGDIVFADDSSASIPIVTSRHQFSWIYIDDNMVKIDAMKSTRDTVNSIPAPLGTNAFVFAREFLDYEQYDSIGKELVTNIGLGFAMIAIIIIVLLANPLASLLTFVCVLSAILELVGFMQFLGAYIDSITVIFLVISLGLAVDYSVHVAHGFLAVRDSDIDKRVETTLAETGAPVINGAVSTMVAALCLSGSSTYVFITFFRSLVFIVLAGAFQGLFVLPVLLSIFKPAPHVDVMKERLHNISSAGIKSVELNQVPSRA